MTEQHRAERKKTTIPDLQKMKSEGRKIVMVTSYDFPTSQIADQVGVDSILVGDSYGMVILGYDTTIPVAMDELLPVCRAVRRGASRPLLVGDMPFLSFQVSREDAIRNAGRFIKEGGMEAVKIEGGKEMASVAKEIADAGIPILGHIGVTPQTATLQGGYRVQGRTAKDGERLIESAAALEEAGAFGLVLEMITEETARTISETLTIPTIGIGSGRYCDGQVLVLNDILGLYPRFTPKFAKRYVDLSQMVQKALQEYSAEVRSGGFPASSNVFSMDPVELSKLSPRRKA